MNTLVALVTGANRGIGKEVARQLAGQGLIVIVGARTLAKAEAAASDLAQAGRVIPAALDVSSDESVDAFVRWLESDGPGRVDVLVNNAGAIFERDDASTFAVSPDVIASAFNTNTLGPYRLCRALMPGMNARGFGRIVNVSTGMAALSDMGGDYPAYRLSKAALNALTRVFDAEARGDVKVNAVCPGWVKTDMGGKSAPLSVEEGARGVVWAATLDDKGPSGGFFRDGAPIEW